MKAIALRSVSKTYAPSTQKVLSDITLYIDSGERAVIFGPSGCGKTTILRIIAGLIPPDKGTVLLGGNPVAKAGRNLVEPEDRNIGMVFQDLALWPHLSVNGNVAFGLKARGVPKREREERSRAILEMVGLADVADRYPAALSGGQPQRVALARALVVKPDVLLMDEPLSSVDEDLNRRLRMEILRLHEELGFTLLYVTHNREEAADIATRLITLKKGRLVLNNGR